jgi:hypothetical protein
MVYGHWLRKSVVPAGTMEERQLSIELLPGLRNVELASVPVGVALLLLRILQPVLAVEHDVGVAIGT